MNSDVQTPDTDVPHQRWIGDIWILAAIVIVFFAISRWQYSGHQRFVCVNRGEVIYTSSVPRDRALNLANVLDKAGVFTGQRTMVVGLGFVDGKHDFKLVVDPQVIENSSPAQMNQLKAQVQQICVSAFGEEPVVVSFADPYLQPVSKVLELP